MRDWKHGSTILVSPRWMDASAIVIEGCLARMSAIQSPTVLTSRDHVCVVQVDKTIICNGGGGGVAQGT